MTIKSKSSLKYNTERVFPTYVNDTTFRIGRILRKYRKQMSLPISNVIKVSQGGKRKTKRSLNKRDDPLNPSEVIKQGH